MYNEEIATLRQKENREIELCTFCASDEWRRPVFLFSIYFLFHLLFRISNMNSYSSFGFVDTSFTSVSIAFEFSQNTLRPSVQLL